MAEVDSDAAAQPMPTTIAQETVPGRVCHVDGDYLAYYASGSDNTTAGAARHIAKNKIETFATMSGSMKARVHLTSGGSTKGERFLIATIKPYQGHRDKGKRPKNWPVLREYLELDPYLPYERKLWSDREADDGLAFESHKVYRPTESVVIATKDKDMRMLPGVHIDWADYTLTHVPKGAYEVIGPYNGLVYGTKWFWLQMLQGDSADFIPGLEKYEGKDIGEVTAAQLLAGTTCNEEAMEVVSSAYYGTYNKQWADRLVEQAGLLWLRTNFDAPINDMLRVVPPCKAVLAAINRLARRVREQREALNNIIAQAAALEDDTAAG